MKKIYTLLIFLPTSIFAQLSIPNNQTISTLNPETGNVGIGTNSPDQKFVVDFNKEPKRIKFFQPEGVNSPYNLVSSLMFTWYNEHADIGMIRGASKNIIGLGFRFNGQEKMRLDNNGNFGIGTSSPDQKFVVDFNKESKKIKFFQPEGTNTAYTLVSSLMFTWYNEHADIGMIRGGDTNIIGLGFRFNGQERMRLDNNGNLGIGTENPDAKLAVKGNIHANEVKVDLDVPADYVFQKYYTGNSALKPSYQFKSLEEIRTFTEQNHHLPDLPSAKEIQENGLKLGEMNNLLLQKVEELTLHLIEQNKKIEELTQEINQLKQK